MHLNSHHAPTLPEEIAQLDLSLIKDTLMRDTGTHRWSSEQVEIAELWYKRFLHLKRKYPDARLVPTKLIDEVWHTHILDTKKYADDCQAIFGCFLHHYPYFGLAGEDDERCWRDAFDATGKVFEREFGDRYDEITRPIVRFGSDPRISSYCSGGSGSGGGRCD